MEIKNITKSVLIFAIMFVISFFTTQVQSAVMKNNNPLLSGINIDGQAIEPAFDQFITDYVLAVDASKETINIEPQTDDPNATAQIIGDTNLKEGVNDFEIKVTAEDGTTTNSYFLHITKGDTAKANVALKDIQVEGLTLNPKFNEKDTNYLVEYEGYIDKLNITAIPEDEKAKVEIIDNENFSSVIHEVTIKVTAQDNITTKEYKITAKKAGENVEDPSGLEQYEEANGENTSQTEENKKAVNPIVVVIIGFAIGTLIGIGIGMVKKGKKK